MTVIRNQGIGIWRVPLVETAVTVVTLTVPPPPGAAPGTLLRRQGWPLGAG